MLGWGDHVRPAANSGCQLKRMALQPLPSLANQDAALLAAHLAGRVCTGPVEPTAAQPGLPAHPR